VLAFWLVVTVVVLSCLLARRSATKPTTGGGCSAAAAHGRWSWSGNQLVGLLDDAPPRDDAHLFPAPQRFDRLSSPPSRWKSTAADARRRHRTPTSYRVLRQRSASDYDQRRPAQTSADLLDSGYDTLAAAAILDEPEPEVTSFVNRGQTEPCTTIPREPTTSVYGRIRGSTRSGKVASRQRRFPKMGQSCLQQYRTSPYLRAFGDAATTPPGGDAVDDDDCPRLTGYAMLPPSDTFTHIGTTAV